MREQKMNDAEMKSRLKELYLPPADEFVLVDVPEMRYIMIDGHSAADRAALDHAVKWLFAVVHPIKRVARERMGQHFVEPPLDGLWWADDMNDFIRGNRDKLSWRMMIVYEPDWLTAEMFDEALAATTARLGEPPAGLRLESYDEGLSAQIMHVGPPSGQTATLTRLHREFLPAHALIPCGHHHEIYLTDPNRVAPEKMKTVLRQPVRRSR
jgi:hypothetical protein